MKLSELNAKKMKEMTSSDWKHFAKENAKGIWMSFAALVFLAVAFTIGLKSVAVVVGLIVFGVGTSLIVRYTGLYLGNDFTLFGAIVGSYLFEPWVGALVVAAEYVLLTFFPADDGVDYPVGAWYFIVALFIMPHLPFQSYQTLHLLLATAIGETGNATYWTLRLGLPVPSQVFYGMLKLGWYAVFFLYFLPGVQAFLA
jgi:hypothetical protein